MSAYPMWQMACDVFGCGACLDHTPGTAKEARLSARSDGWTTRRVWVSRHRGFVRLDLCQEHSADDIVVDGGRFIAVPCGGGS